MSRILSIIAFIVLLILLLVLFKQCAPKHQITKQSYNSNNSVTSEGVIKRSETTIVQSPNNTFQSSDTVKDSKDIDQIKPQENQKEKQTLSPAEAVANAAQKAQENRPKPLNGKQYIILQGVNFKFGSAELDPNTSTQLQRIIKRLKNKPELTIEIAGYADSSEDSGVNKGISQLRSEAVKDYILSHGIKADRLVAKHYNSSAPVADNSTVEGRKQNRRVEIHVKL